MDIKDLNKSQLILLAILLSFITSIATGIVTVTLMQQAPSSVTVPINRIVRQTVEKIVPVPGKKTIQTIIIKEEALVVDAIAKNKSAIFSVIKETQDSDGKTIEVKAGRGFVISKEGIIVADSSAVSNSKGVYYIKNDSGKFKANFVSLNKKGFTFLKIGAPLDEKNKIDFTIPTFGDLSKMKIGQKVLVLGDTISSFIFDRKDVRINITKSNRGALVLDLNGEVLGIALYGGTTSFASIDSIIEALKEKDTISDTISESTPVDATTTNTTPDTTTTTP